MVSLVLASMMVMGLVILAPQEHRVVEAAPPTKATKFEVCHRTNAIKNPYRRITVAWSSVKPNGGHDKASHDGPVFDIANPVASHGTTPRDTGLAGDAGGGNDRWGDIFYAYINNGKQNENNWTTAGQAVFNGATFTYNGVTKQACQTMSIQQYIKAEKEAAADDPNLSITMAEIMAELDEMGASEDYAVLEALGGSFTTWYTTNGGGSEDPDLIAASITAASPSVTTTTPTSVIGTDATLNGTIDPQGQSMVWYFEYGTDPNFTTPAPSTTVDATDTTSKSVSILVSGLTPGQTYYYRTVGVVDNGLTGDDLLQTFLYGEVQQFNSDATPAPTITGITCQNEGLSIAFTDVSDPAITDYETSLDGGAWATVGAATSPVSVGSLVNGQSYSVRLRAVATVSGLSSAAVTGVPCGAPGATTRLATDVADTTATLNGTGTAGGLGSHAYFVYDTNATLAVAPTTIAAGPATLLTTDTTRTLSLGVTGLTGSTTYYFQTVVTNSAGAAYGTIESFTTAAAGQPLTTTLNATSVTRSAATLNGTGTANGNPTDASFVWGTSSTLTGGDTATVAATPSSLASASTSAALSHGLSGLSPATTYYFRTYVTNSAGSAYGAILSFSTPAVTPPATNTSAATGVTATVAQLNGTGTSNGLVTNASFVWGTSPTLTGGDTTTVAASSSPLGSGASADPLTLGLTGLTGSTTYYFQTFVTNANGSAYGSILSFTTSAPVVTTGPPPPPSSVASPSTSTPISPATTEAPASTTTGPPAAPRGGGAPTRDERLPQGRELDQLVAPSVESTDPAEGTLTLNADPEAPPVELLGATIDDPDYEVEIVFTGVDYNKPATWQAQGFGDECWKIEDFGDGDYAYTLPSPPAPPSGDGRPATYSLVKVKAGSLTSTDPDFQVNTVFNDPAPGSSVFPDSNRNGISDPGGRGGDKSISHIIFCVSYDGGTAPPVASPTTAPGTTSPGTSAPTTTAPSTTAPSTTAPGTTAPGTTAPSTSAPGTTSPTTAPGTTAPSTSAPGTTSPTTAPGTSTPATTAPATSVPATPTTTPSLEPTSPIVVNIVRRSPEPALSEKTLRVALVVSSGVEQVTLTYELAARPQGLEARLPILPAGEPVTLPRTGEDTGRMIWLSGLLVMAGLAIGTRRWRMLG